MRFYFDLFYSFFKIGAFTLGGGYVMIPLIEKEMVQNKKWIQQEDFTDMLALAQSAPGPIAINTAVFVGYKLRKLKGLIVSVSGVALPAFVTILLVAVFFNSIRENPIFERIFSGIRPAVVALIIVPVVNMLKKGGFRFGIITIAAASALAVWGLNISPVWVMAGAGVMGLVYGKFRIKN
ncbi:MAG: chromate transporter [Tannerella sp.]|jgi:chromate transporter|nr:chromate transporter [Tannerella sp.]